MENLTDRQRDRLEQVWAADERHVTVEVAWQCAQLVRSAYHQDTHAQGRAIAEQIIDSFHTCPIPEVARLGRTLRQWRQAFLGYFDTGGASNGPTEANGRLEHLRGTALGFRNLSNYITRSLLETGGFRPQLHPQL